MSKLSDLLNKSSTTAGTAGIKKPAPLSSLLHKEKTNEEHKPATNHDGGNNDRPTDGNRHLRLLKKDDAKPAETRKEEPETGGVPQKKPGKLLSLSRKQSESSQPEPETKGRKIQIGKKTSGGKSEELQPSDGLVKPLPPKEPEPTDESVLESQLKEMGQDKDHDSLVSVLSQMTVPADNSEQFKYPTIEELQDYVFEEQPEKTQAEAADKFSLLLSQLAQAVGIEMEKKLVETRDFLQEHAFLVDILHPESISVMVTAMRKVYKFSVQQDATRQKKKSKRAEKQDAINAMFQGLGMNLE